jgi:hypothetical protein
LTRPFGALALVVVVLGALATLAGPACDNENSCTGLCPTGQRYTNDGTCTCVPFDAGYCAKLSDCADAYCPAMTTPDACGGGQMWSTTVCGCYSLPDGGLPSKG